MKQFKTVRDLADELEKDSTLVQAIKDNPEEALSRMAASPLHSDVWIYRIVVTALGLTVLAAIMGAIYIAVTTTGGDGKPFETPQILLALGSAAVGALAGLLAPSPKSE